MHHLVDNDIEASTDLALLWHSLCEHRLYVSEASYAGGRCVAVVNRAQGRKAPAEHVRLVERRFQGESQKAMAIELGVAVGTIAGYAAQALAALFHGHRVSRAPIILVMAAHAARGLPQRHARLEERRSDGSSVISVEVPGHSLRDRLSSSEWDVARLSIEGATHTDIARARGRSVRTIANQLAAVFGKLQISGRSELRAMAVREAGEVVQNQRLPTPSAPQRASFASSQITRHRSARGRVAQSTGDCCSAST